MFCVCAPIGGCRFEEHERAYKEAKKRDGQRAVVLVVASAGRKTVLEANPPGVTEGEAKPSVD